MRALCAVCFVGEIWYYSLRLRHYHCSVSVVLWRTAVLSFTSSLMVWILACTELHTKQSSDGVLMSSAPKWWLLNIFSGTSVECQCQTASLLFESFVPPLTSDKTVTDLILTTVGQTKTVWLIVVFFFCMFKCQLICSLMAAHSNKVLVGGLGAQVSLVLHQQWLYCTFPNVNCIFAKKLYTVECRSLPGSRWWSTYCNATTTARRNQQYHFSFFRQCNGIIIRHPGFESL